MSEYLDRLKHLRDATPPPGNAKNVQSNVSFRRAIDYIEKLEKDLEVNNAVNEGRGETILNELEAYQEIRNKLDAVNEQREADKINIINILSQFYITCDDKKRAFGITMVQHLITEYYEVK